MKFKMFVLFLSLGMNHLLFAGGSSTIPVELIEIDNLGRAEFIKNALAESNLSGFKNVEYRDFLSVVIGGDEDGSDYTGGYFGFRVKLISQTQKFECDQLLAVGSFKTRFPHLTGLVKCSEI